ncbi:MAG: PAS domain S-box protein [Ferruginibacter sp.]
MNKNETRPVEILPQSFEKNNNQPSNLLNLVPALIAYIDKNHCYQYVNNAYANWIGVEAENLVGKPVAEVIGKDNFLDAKPYIDIVLSGVASRFESTRYNKEDLRHLDIHLIPDFNEAKEVQGYAVHINDITDKKRPQPQFEDIGEKGNGKLSAEERLQHALEESKDRYNNLLQLLPTAVYTCDASGYIQLYNQTAVDLWGREPEIGKDMWCGSWKIFDPVTGAEIPLDSCPMSKVLKEGREVIGEEIVVERPDGVRRNVIPHPRPIFDLSGKLTGAINMLIDVTEERLASKALHDKDQRFKMIAHLVPIVIWMSDEQGNIIYLNKEWSDLTGKTPQDGYGNKWLHFIHPEDRPRTEVEFMQSNSEGRIYIDKFRYRKADASYLILAANGIPRFNEAGTFIGHIGVFQDIDQQELTASSLEVLVTERTADLIQQTEALKRSEERYQRMVKEVQDYAIILLNTEGNIENWNNGAQRIKGYEAKEVLGKKSRIFYTAADQERRLPEKLLQEAAENGRAEHEGWRVRKDGSYFWGSVVITALHDDNGELIGFSKVTRDLSERKKTEDKLRDFTEELKQKNEYLRLSEQRYQRMIAEVQDYAILQLNENGDIVNWNAGAELIKGYSASEIIGKNFRSFYSKQDRENQLPERLLELAREKGKATHEGWRIRKDGTRFWGNIVITALHNDNNEVIGFSKVTRDLTERKEAEEALKEKNRELEKRNQELSEFAYISSHDLQEPLRKIQTFITRILESEGERFSEKGRDFFSRIQSSSIRMRTLIEDLLAYSRTNNTEQKFVVTDLNKLLQEVKHELNEIIEEKKAVIESTPLPKLDVVPFQFHQLIVNILTNGLKFSKKDVAPHISIKANIIKGSEVQDTAADELIAYHHISFKDNGIGFESQYNNKVFEVFQRLHGRAEYEGTGIGLAICKKIMENHSGIITAEGCLGEGATFHLYLPVS